MLTDKELQEIEGRNRDRKKLREDIPPGQWMYDWFAFIENGNVPGSAPVRCDDRVCIVVRRRPWIDALIRACGDGILDEGTFTRGDEKDAQPGFVGLYVEKAMDGSAETDIDALLAEVRNLREMKVGK